MVEVLQRIVAKTASLSPSKSNLLLPLEFNTHFTSTEIPSISFSDYIQRIFRYVNCSDSIYVVVLIYIDRIVSRYHSFIVNSRNVFR